MNNGGGKTERFLFCSLRLSVFAVLFAQCCSSEEVCDAIPNAFGNAIKNYSWYPPKVGQVQKKKTNNTAFLKLI
jgi:hypothetical protein